MARDSKKDAPSRKGRGFDTLSSSVLRKGSKGTPKSPTSGDGTREADLRSKLLQKKKKRDAPDTSPRRSEEEPDLISDDDAPPTEGRRTTMFRPAAVPTAGEPASAREDSVPGGSAFGPGSASTTDTAPLPALDTSNPFSTGSQSLAGAGRSAASAALGIGGPAATPFSFTASGLNAGDVTPKPVDGPSAAARDEPPPVASGACPGSSAAPAIATTAAPAFTFGGGAASIAAAGFGTVHTSAPPEQSPTPDTATNGMCAAANGPSGSPPPSPTADPDSALCSSATASGGVIEVDSSTVAACQLPADVLMQAAEVMPMKEGGLRGQCEGMISGEELKTRDPYGFEQNRAGKWDMDKALAAYARSAAAREYKPHMVRTPAALSKSFVHILHNIVDIHTWRDKTRFAETYAFFRDRWRAISQEFSLQGIVSKSRVKVTQMAVRFFILSSHLMCESYGDEGYSTQQNNERMSEGLTDLRHLYREGTREEFPDQPEFACYVALQQMLQVTATGDYTEWLGALQNLPDWVRKSAELRFALEAFEAAYQGRYTKFFKLLNKATYLQACLMHSAFSLVRKEGLKKVLKSMLQKERIPLDDVVRWFAFNDEDDAAAFVMQWTGVEVQDGFMVKTAKATRAPEGLPEQKVSRRIEAKRFISYSVDYRQLLNRHIMQGFDQLCDARDRAALLAKDKVQQAGIRRPEDWQPVRRENVIVLDGSGPPRPRSARESTRAASDVPAPVVAPTDVPKTKKGPRVSFADEAPFGAAAKGAAAPSPFPSGPSATPPRVFGAPQTAQSSSAAAFTFLSSSSARPPQPSSGATAATASTPFTFGLAQPPALGSAPPPREPPQPAVPVPPPPPPASTVTLGLVAALAAATAALPALPPAPAPSPRLSHGLPFSPKMRPPSLPRSSASRDSPARPPSEGPADAALPEREEDVCMDLEETAAPAEEVVPLPMVLRDGVACLSAQERALVMDMVLAPSALSPGTGCARERLKALVDAWGPKAADSIGARWPRRPAHTPLDVRVLLAKQVGALRTVPVLALARRGELLSWELVVLSTAPLSARPELVPEPGLADWVAGRLLSTRGRQAACQAPEMLGPTLAVYLVEEDSHPAGDPNNIEVAVCVRHAVTAPEPPEHLPAFCTLLYVFDPAGAALDPALEMQALRAGLPVRAARACDVPPAVLVIHDARLRPQTKEGARRFWRATVGGEVLFLDIATAAPEDGYVYDPETRRFRSCGAVGPVTAALRGPEARGGSQCLGLALQLLFDDAVRHVRRAHTSYHFDLAELLDVCLEECLGPPVPTQCRSPVARDLQRLLRRRWRGQSFLPELCRGVLNAVLRAVTDAVGELPHVLCYVRRDDPGDGTGAWHDEVGVEAVVRGLSELQLPAVDAAAACDESATPLRALWQSLRTYGAACLRKAVAALEPVACAETAAGPDVLPVLEWLHAAKILDGKLAVCLTDFERRVKAVPEPLAYAAKGALADDAIRTCFGVVRTVGEALVAVVEACGITLHCCSPCEAMGTLVAARCAVETATEWQGGLSDATPLHPFFKTFDRLWPQSPLSPTAAASPAPQPTAAPVPVQPSAVPVLKRARGPDPGPTGPARKQPRTGEGGLGVVEVAGLAGVPVAERIARAACRRYGSVRRAVQVDGIVRVVFDSACDARTAVARLDGCRPSGASVPLRVRLGDIHQLEDEAERTLYRCRETLSLSRAQCAPFDAGHHAVVEDHLRRWEQGTLPQWKQPKLGLEEMADAGQSLEEKLRVAQAERARLAQLNQRAAAGALDLSVLLRAKRQGLPTGLGLGLPGDSEPVVRRLLNHF